jgi:hypothetical protein
MMERAVRIAVLVVLAGTLAACATQPNIPPPSGAPGFWWGLLHGFTCGFTLIGEAIGMNVSIYSYPNNGGWYDFGFVMGCSLFYGGSGSRA